jgi:hypothetical protein
MPQALRIAFSLSQLQRQIRYSRNLRLARNAWTYGRHHGGKFNRRSSAWNCG